MRGQLTFFSLQFRCQGFVSGLNSAADRRGCRHGSQRSHGFIYYYYTRTGGGPLFILNRCGRSGCLHLLRRRLFHFGLDDGPLRSQLVCAFVEYARLQPQVADHIEHFAPQVAIARVVHYGSSQLSTHHFRNVEELLFFLGGNHLADRLYDLVLQLQGQVFFDPVLETDLLVDQPFVVQLHPFQASVDACDFGAELFLGLFDLVESCDLFLALVEKRVLFGCQS